MAERRVFLVRHGRTALNAAGVLRGRLDPALDQVGREEAKALCAVFSGLPVTLVLSSPLRRAMETATPIARATGAVLRAEDAFIDRDYGAWAGRPLHDLEARYGSVDAAPGIEPLEALATRCTAKLCDEAALIDTLVVVTHDIINRAILAYLCVNTPDDPDQIAQSTGCWNQLVHRADGWHASTIDAKPRHDDT
jgi:broad specificity phosphatase PhoE